MTIPDTDAIDTYGGAVSDFAGVAMVDSSTDIPATSANKQRASVAGMTHMIGRAEVTFTGATYAGPGTDSITVTSHDAVWGNAAGVKPTVGQTTAGRYVITWPTSVLDELSASHSVALRRVKDVRFVGTTPYLWTEESTSANVSTVRIWTTGGVANAANGVTITVEVR